jgi:hypothetical protein
MKYVQFAQGSSFPYPNHAVDPKKKDAKWCMQYAKAAYYDFTFAYPKGVLASNGGDYDKNRMYALGKQPNTQYKRWLGVDQQTNNTWLSIDWSIRSIISTYRDRTISRLMKEDYNVIATAVDALAKTEEVQYYSDMVAKLAVMDLLKEVNSDLATHPIVMPKADDPMDMEELKMRMANGEQFNRSKDAELAIMLGFYENGYTSFRRAVYEDLFDYGIAGVKDWLGDDNKPKFRRVDPKCAVTSFSKDATFNGIVHAGELIEVPLVELATLTNEDGSKMFTEEELQEFASTLIGRYGNPSMLNYSNGWLRPIDKFKCQVMDIEFFTYNDNVYADVSDENGNSDFRKSDYGRGKKSNKYKRKRIEYVYKCKWIVGTDHCYDWGMAYDQKRSQNTEKKAKTKLSYTFCAYNFSDMKAQSFMDRLIPYIDDYQLTMLKIQNFKNRAVPSGWWINLDMLENVALSKGGKNMEPKELLQMFFETGVLVGRGLQMDGSQYPGNIQPVIAIANTAAAELAMFYQDLLNTISAIEKMTGYNEITSGEPNPKTLIPGYEIANQSTNDALYPLSWAEENISLRLAENVLCRTQQGLKKGGVSGYAKAINSSTLKFIELDKGLSLREFGVMLEKKSTEQDRMWIMQQLQGDIANGFLSTADAIMIINTHNAKQAMEILAYRVKKAKEQAQKYELQKLQAQSMGNAQVAQAAEAAKQQTKMMELQADIEKHQMIIMGELKKKEMELQAQIQMKMLELGVKQEMNTESNMVKKHGYDVTAEAKIIASDVQNEGKAIASAINAEGAIEKQKEANKKPQPKSPSKK